MTCRLLDTPRAVFVHIPKTAGTSILSMWPDQPKTLAFGHIPADWQDAPCFAVVRAPVDRFLSAVRMFRDGNGDVHGSFTEPTLPDLTVSAALDILEDDGIPFDRVQRHSVAKFKHHAIPQTHPFNCLHLAGTILRHERLSQDWPALADRLDLPTVLPRLRTTDTGAPLEVTEADMSRIRRIFARDFDLLGYAEDGTPLRETAVPRPEAEGIWPLWPALFSNRVIRAKRGRHALPDPEVDLSPFAETTIAGHRGKTWPGRENNLVDHFHRLQPEFTGAPMIAHLLACCIVVIRRTDGDPAALRLFHRIMAEHTGTICAALNTRWLVSVTDTLADHGATDAQRVLGVAGSLLANTVKLAETERRIFHAPRPWPPKHRFTGGGPLFDGTIAFWTERGDMIENMLARLENIQATDAAAPVVLELMVRMMSHDTVYSRVVGIAGQEPPPILPEEIAKRFDRLTRKWL